MDIINLKVVEEAHEKVLNAEESYGLVDRYLRKLDLELHKFKLELEADNRGITEILEKHSLELDLPQTNLLKENRHPKKHVRIKFFGRFFIKLVTLYACILVPVSIGNL